MTTILTTVGNNFATLVADRGVTSDVIHHDMSKIFNQGTWLIGASGDSRICDLFAYGIKYPKPPKSLLTKSNNDWYKWMVLNVVPLIEKIIPKGESDFEAILVTHAKSFYVGSNLSITNAMPYWAIGSGGTLALGVLASMQYDDNWNKDHDIKAKYALSVAQMHDPFTRGGGEYWRSDHTGLVYAI